MHLTQPRYYAVVLFATLLAVSAAFFWTSAAGASIAVGTDLAGVDTVDLIARAGADPTADDDTFATHVAGDVALDLPVSFAEILGTDAQGSRGYVFAGRSGFVLIQDLGTAVASAQRHDFTQTFIDNMIDSDALYGAAQTLNDPRWGNGDGTWDSAEFVYAGSAAGYDLYGDAVLLFLDDSTWYASIIFPVDASGSFHEGVMGAIRDSLRPATADDAASTETENPFGLSVPMVVVGDADAARLAAPADANGADTDQSPASDPATLASPAGTEATASIIDANASTLLAQIAHEHTDAICSYLTAENVADLVEMDGGVHKTVVYEKLGLAEMAQLFAFTTWDDLYAGFYTLAEDSSAFMTAYRASWDAIDGKIGGEVKSLIDHVQGLSGVPYVYERPVGDWTGDVVVLLATRESGYAFATLFSQLDTYHMVATTYLVRLQDTGDWASFVTSLLPFDSVTPDSPYPAFEGTTVGEKRIDPLPDNGIPSGAAKTLGPGTDDSGASDEASATRPS